MNHSGSSTAETPDAPGAESRWACRLTDVARRKNGRVKLSASGGSDRPVLHEFEWTPQKGSVVTIAMNG